MPVNQELLRAVQALESKIERISQNKTNKKTSIKESAFGSVAADATIYAAKKIFSPSSLPATKGDINMLIMELNRLKNLINSNLVNNSHYKI